MLKLILFLDFGGKWILFSVDLDPHSYHGCFSLLSMSGFEHRISELLVNYIKKRCEFIVEEHWSLLLSCDNNNIRK